MYYKRYKPTCVELLFGRSPQKFMAQCAIPRHQNARLRCPCTSGQAQQSSKCRYCPNKFTNSPYDQRFGNVLRIDDFCSENTNRVAGTGNNPGRRLNPKPKSQWQKQGEFKSRKEKFQEWFVNKRVREMKEDVHDDEECFDCCCCTYCCGDIREDTPNEIMRCGCCVCGEANHDILGERLSEDVSGDDDDLKPDHLVENTFQNPRLQTRNRHQNEFENRQNLRKRQEQVDFHSNTGFRKFGNFHEQGNRVKGPLRRESSESLERFKSPNNINRLNERKFEKESKPITGKDKGLKCHNTNDCCPCNKENNLSSPSEDEEARVYLENLKDDSLNRMKEKRNYPGVSDRISPKAITCNCEYSYRKANADLSKCMYDVKEMQRLRSKLDAALEEIKKCRHEVERTRNTNAKFNCETDKSDEILNDCQKRCAHLEQLVQRLDRNLGNFEDSSMHQRNLDVAGKKGEQRKLDARDQYRRRREGSPDIYSRLNESYMSRHTPERDLPRGARNCEEEVNRKYNNRTKGEDLNMGNHRYPRSRTDKHTYSTPRRPRSAEDASRQQKSYIYSERSNKNAENIENRQENQPKRILRRSSSSPKPSGLQNKKQKEAPTYEVKEQSDCRKPGGVCYHIRCYPSDHILNNPKFVGCRDYEQVVENMRRKRFFKPR